MTVHVKTAARLLVISWLMSYIGVFSVDNFRAEFTLIGHVEMFAVGALNVVLDCVKFAAMFATNQTGMSWSSVIFDKFLQQSESF